MEVTCLDTEVFEMMLSRAKLLAKRVSERAELGEMNPLAEWKSADETSVILHISPRRLQTLRKSEKLPYSTIERKIFYHSDDIMKLLGNKHLEPNDSNI